MRNHQRVLGRYVVRAPFFVRGQYTVRYRDELTGRIVSRATGKESRRAAMDDVLAHLEAVESERDSCPTMRFRDAYELFLSEREVRPVTMLSLRRDFAGIFGPHFGRFLVREITPAYVSAFLARRREQGRSVRTRRRQLGELRVFFRWARRLGYCSSDPTDGFQVRTPRGVAKHGTALTHDEAVRLLGACARPATFRTADHRRSEGWQQSGPSRADLRLAILASLHTGLRRRNVLRLRWSHVEFDANRIVIPGCEMKAGRDFMIPIHPELAGAFRERRLECADNELVLGARKSFTTAFRRVLAEAGCPAIRWHDLRHTFATWLAPRVPYAVLQGLLGHSPGSVTFHYLHVPWDELMKGVQALPALLVSTTGTRALGS